MGARARPSCSRSSASSACAVRSATGLRRAPRATSSSAISSSSRRRSRDAGKSRALGADGGSPPTRRCSRRWRGRGREHARAGAVATNDLFYERDPARARAWARGRRGRRRDGGRRAAARRRAARRRGRLPARGHRHLRREARAADSTPGGSWRPASGRPDRRGGAAGRAGRDCLQPRHSSARLSRRPSSAPGGPGPARGGPGAPRAAGELARERASWPRSPRGAGRCRRRRERSKPLVEAVDAVLDALEALRDRAHAPRQPLDVGRGRDVERRERRLLRRGRLLARLERASDRAAHERVREQVLGQPAEGVLALLGQPLASPSDSVSSLIGLRSSSLSGAI